MASDDVGLSPVPFYDNPEYKRHPNNTKTDQLPISEVITGLPRPYHNTIATIIRDSILKMISVGTVHNMVFWVDGIQISWYLTIWNPYRKSNVEDTAEAIKKYQKSSGNRCPRASLEKDGAGELSSWSFHDNNLQQAPGTKSGHSQTNIPPWLQCLK